MTHSSDKIPARDRTTYRRSHAVRRSDYDYAGPDDIHLIISAKHGAPLTEGALAREICDAIEHACQIRSYRLDGYCLMPDHLHVLLSPAESRTPIGDWLHTFKGFTTSRHVKRGGKPPLWQRSAYDHVCRSEETAERVLGYIVSNPIRAGLVERWGEWPWPWTRTYIDV